MKRAGENSTELQKVLDHYSINESDSLKYKAAVFLIENMEYHFGVEQTIYQNGQVTDEFSWGKENMLHSLKTENVKEKRNQIINQTIDSLGITIQRGEALWDIEYITSDLLIENINYAFKAWEMPWSKHLTFSDFCEYILPYRCQTEPLTQWRKYFFDKYSWIKDSLPSDCKPLSACTFLKDQLKQQLIYSNRHRTFYRGYLPPHFFENVGIGTCENLASYTSLIMRSIGIPVLYDKALYWANSDVGHVFNWVVTNDSIAGYHFGIVDGIPRRILKNFGKVIRNTYQNHENPLWKLFVKGNLVVPSLCGINQKDVTHLHCQTDTLVMSIKENDPKAQLYYLCQIGKNGELKALNYSAVDNQKKLHFTNTTTPYVYILEHTTKGI